MPPCQACARMEQGIHCCLLAQVAELGAAAQAQAQLNAQAEARLKQEVRFDYYVPGAVGYAGVYFMCTSCVLQEFRFITLDELRVTQSI